MPWAVEEEGPGRDIGTRDGGIGAEHTAVGRLVTGDPDVLVHARYAIEPGESVGGIVTESAREDEADVVGEDDLSAGIGDCGEEAGAGRTLRQEDVLGRRVLTQGCVLEGDGRVEGALARGRGDGLLITGGER